MSTADATPLRRDLPSIALTPSAEDWARMSEEARGRFFEATTDSLQAEAERMPEGSKHIRGKHWAFATLRDHFAREGRSMYINMEMPALYPGEAPFCPDLFAVLDMADPGHEDKRRAWVVAEEGRGFDLVLEVLVHGDRRKDLIENVARYARLGVTEYFVYDRLYARLIGYRQPSAGAPYRPIPQRGRWLASSVLGLNLGMTGDRLVFAVGESEIYESAVLVERLNRAVEDLTRRADQAESRAEVETTAREEAERRAETAEAARQEADRRIAELLARLGEG